MSFRLDGRKALVTGASRGIGAAIAVAYAQAGADVAISARDEAKLADVAQQIEAMGRTAIVVPADVLDGEALRAAVDAASLALGGLDLLVNNAGGNSFSTPVANMRFSGWQKTFSLNVESIVHACQAAAPHLLASDHGSVINVSSVASLAGTPFMAHYGAAKAAVSSLTKTLAIEWAHANVRVNALVPGWVETDLTDFLRADDNTETSLLSRVPMQRWGRVNEMAEPAVFLASDASSFMTGQQLVVDGGLSVMP
ncbi:MAG: SDR family oxidoreductase [Candidatus Nanopelagicales bacterium]|nr:SDR family oxidoreductase [Candidatus Nanopelagicales bacterium]